MWVLVALLWAAAGGSLWNGANLLGVVFIAAAALDLGLILWFRRLQPTGYVIDADGLAIERRAGARRYVGAVGEPRAARLGLRLWGSGGLGGYLGLFRLAGGGRVRAHVTDLARVVVVPVGAVEVAISPARPEEVVHA